MKKILFTLLAITFVSSLCFAGQKVVSPVKTTSTSAEVKTFTGNVESIALGDAAKKTKSEIVLTEEKGQKLSLVVKAGTVILDKDGKATTLSKIAKGDKVTAEYTTGKTGTNKAKSIKVVK